MLKKLITNSFSNVAMRFLNIAMVFIMTPIIIRSLGRHDYGIWEIVISVTGYMGLLQFGIFPAIVRYVAKYNALKDREKLNQIYSSFFLIFLAVGSFCTLIICGWAFIYPEILAEDGLPSQKYTFFLLIVAFKVFQSFPGLVIQGFYEGFQKYNFINFITAVQIIITNIIVYFLFKNGYGLIAFALVTGILYTLKALVLWALLMLPSYGQYRIRKEYVNKALIKELYVFGLKSFMLGVTSRIAFNTDSIVIGSFLGPAVVPFYVIPVNLINKIKDIMMSFTLGFMPHFSELNAQGNKEDIVTSFLSYSRYTVGIAIVMLMGALFLGIPFINIWMGPEYAEKGKSVLYIIGIAFFFPFLNPFQGRFLTSMGRHGILVKIAFPAAILNLILSIIFVQYYGIVGVALGTLVPAAMIEPFILYQVSKVAGFKMFDYVFEVLICQLVPVVIASLSYHCLLGYIRPDSYLNILMVASICSIIYLCLFFVFVVSGQERKIIFSKLFKRTLHS
ncbi:MAG: oligosaccharide flippase family protein [Proteobacteria bacterium]|nr:oligosaccharide flippase family protein [Pseudomonadota bacterium]